MSDAPVRNLDDGHLSPLDLVAIQGNLNERLTGLDSGLNDAQRSLDATPGAGTIGHPQLWPANVYEPETGTAAEMRCIDLLQLVSGQVELIFAGMPCVMNQDELVNLYFRASADDDSEEYLSAGLYGLRNPVSRTVTLRVRYLSPGALDDDLVLHYMNTGSETTILASGGDTWRDIGGGDEYFQVFTSAATAVTVFGASLYLKRAASPVSGQWLTVRIYPLGGEGWPDEAAGPPLAIAEVDLDDVSTTGAWTQFSFTEGWTPELETQYGVVLSKSGENEAEAYWYQDTDAGGAGYADGYSGFMGYGGDVVVEPTLEPTKDYYLKLLVAAEDTLTVASGSPSDGWQEAETEVTLRLASDFLSGDNMADFYLELPQYMYLNAVLLYDHDTRGEIHWRAGHVRTPPIHVMRSGAASDGDVLTADGAGGAAWSPQAAPVGILHTSAQTVSGSTYSQDSSSWTTIRSLSSIELTKACRVCLQAQAIGYTGSSGNPVEIQIYQGDTALGYPSRQPATSYSPLICVYDYNLAAGTYTWNLKYRRNGGSGTVYVAYIVFNVKAFTTE